MNSHIVNCLEPWPEPPPATARPQTPARGRMTRRVGATPRYVYEHPKPAYLHRAVTRKWFRDGRKGDSAEGAGI